MSVSTERPQQSPPRGPGGLKREHIIWIAVGLLVLVLGFGLAALVANRRVNDKDKGVLLGQEQAGGTVAAIGPLNGTDLNQYVPARKQALEKASGDRVAVVSFDRYIAAPQAIGTAGRLKVIALVAALPGGTPSTVKGVDIRTWAKQQRDAAVAERDQTRELIKTVDDPDYKTFYQSEVGRLDKLIASVNPDGPVVFAVVVEGPVAELQALGKLQAVRLVDVGASDKVSDGTEYHGVRPEQNGNVDQNTPRSF